MMELTFRSVAPKEGDLEFLLMGLETITVEELCNHSLRVVDPTGLETPVDLNAYNFAREIYLREGSVTVLFGYEQEPEGDESIRKYL